MVLPHVLVLAVHLVNFFSWMSQGGHSEQIIFDLICDFSVSPSPFGLDFGTLDLDFGLGLDNISDRQSDNYRRAQEIGT